MMTCVRGHARSRDLTICYPSVLNTETIKAHWKEGVNVWHFRNEKVSRFLKKVILKDDCSDHQFWEPEILITNTDSLTTKTKSYKIMINNKAQLRYQTKAHKVNCLFSYSQSEKDQIAFWSGEIKERDTIQFKQPPFSYLSMDFPTLQINPLILIYKHSAIWHDLA